ncbi:MAG: catechol 2,3-dioxygenase [Pseudomonadales bacterium]|nr:catechol 2,3-dioxygenase [Pseudomonadales bacterium]MCP5172291.1 catechol 2,3-dioxygenase [Pseudomonadales bacterium]
MAMTGILRPGHICLRVLDLEVARKHYLEVVGLVETARDDDCVYLKAWDEHDAYSVILRQSDRSGMDFYGFKVKLDSDLDHYQARLEAAGCTVKQLPAGDLPRCGRRLQFQLPTGHTLELYAEKEQVGNGLPLVNPDPWPDGLKGAAVRRLDHIAIYGDQLTEAVDLLVNVLDFSITEQLVDGDLQLAVFMSCSTKAHDIAIVRHPEPDKLHHVSFLVGSWEQVLRAADIVSKTKTRMALTPTRHGITRGQTCYFYDPSGNCNETFCDDSWYYPDNPVITWTADQAGRSLLYHHEEVIEPFMAACT